MKVHDLLVMDRHAGAPGVWRVVAINLGGLGQESVVELEVLDKTPPVGDGVPGRIFVPEIMLSALFQTVGADDFYKGPLGVPHCVAKAETSPVVTHEASTANGQLGLVRFQGDAHQYVRVPIYRDAREWCLIDGSAPYTSASCQISFRHKVNNHTTYQTLVRNDGMSDK